MSVPTSHDVVCVVDDDHAVLDSMTEMLDAAGLSARTFASAEEFLRDFEPETAACVVLDICMAGMDGLDLGERLCQEHPDIPVIIMTGHGSVPRARRSFKMGAMDFIEKPFSNRQLLALIRNAVEIGQMLRKKQAHQANLKARLALLSEREGEIVDMIVAGMLNKQMAASLGLHERTIEFHRKNIMCKLQVESVPELVQMVVENRTLEAIT